MKKKHARIRRPRKEIMKMFGNHFVSLVVRVGPKGSKTDEKDRICNFSGFILSIRGVWHLVTAGHILRAIEVWFGNGQFKQAELIDSYGNAYKTEIPTPFDLERAIKTYIDDDDDGLDFGLITFAPYYQRLLQANGIEPFSEKTWENGPADFERFLLLGLPFEVNPQDHDPAKVVVSPVLLAVERLRDRPAGFAETQFPRFYGQLGPAKLINDINGMSGGPIFGIAKDQDGNRRYWAVAVQSAWQPSTRIIAACPLPVMGAIIEDSLRDVNSEEGQ